MRVILIFIKCQFIFTSLCSEEEFEAIPDYTNQNHSIMSRKKEIKFKLDEMNQFHDSISRLKEMNNDLIKYICKLENPTDHDDFYINLSFPLEIIIDNITETRKKFVCSYSAEYEFMEFCEVFYRILQHIIRNEKSLYMNFVQFSKNSIIPICTELTKQIKFPRFPRISNLIGKKSHHKEISDQKRLDALLCFLYRFIRKQNPILVLSQIAKNCRVADLLPVCFKLFSTFYPFNYEKKIEFEEEFKKQKYNISSSFCDCLFTHSRLELFSYEGRAQLKKFQKEIGLNLETQFVEQNLIPSCCENFNRQILRIIRCESVGVSVNQQA